MPMLTDMEAQLEARHTSYCTILRRSNAVVTTVLKITGQRTHRASASLGACSRTSRGTYRVYIQGLWCM